MRIRAGLMQMKMSKNIRAEVNCHWKDITAQAALLGLQRVYLTREERLMIGKHRGLQTKDIP